MNNNTNPVDPRAAWLDGTREAAILEHIAGGCAIRSVAERLRAESSAPGGLTEGFLVRWLSMPERADAFREARAQAAEHLIDDILDFVKASGGEAGSENIKILTIKTEIHRWVAARWRPDTYGDKSRFEAAPGMALFKELKALELQALKQKEGHEPTLKETGGAPQDSSFKSN